MTNQSDMAALAERLRRHADQTVESPAPHLTGDMKFYVFTTETRDLMHEAATALAARLPNEWRTDWPELTCRDPTYPNCLESERVIVALDDGTVTYDRAERFAELNPEWFIHRKRVIAWRPFPPSPTGERP